jgi:hypothetical protein
MKEKSYSYTVQFTSDEEKDKYSDIISNLIYNDYLARFGLTLWTCRMRLTSQDLLVIKLKYPDLNISRTYLPKKERVLQTLKKFGVELQDPEILWKPW